MYQITFPSKNGVSTFERVGSLRKLDRSDAGAMAESNWDGSVVYWTGRAWKPADALTDKQREAFLGY